MFESMEIVKEHVLEQLNQKNNWIWDDSQMLNVIDSEFEEWKEIFQTCRLFLSSERNGHHLAIFLPFVLIEQVHLHEDPGKRIYFRHPIDIPLMRYLVHV